MPEQGPLFTAGATRWLRGSIIVGIVAVVATPTLLALWVRSPAAMGVQREIVQPIPFDHRHHVHDAGIACTFCHRRADDHAHAGMPDADLCMRCHQQVLAHADVLAPLREAHREQRDIVWRRVHELPDFTFFHHGVHVEAGIDCSRCHGEVADMASVRQVRTLDMGWCLDCHQHPADVAVDRTGPMHCSACHR